MATIGELIINLRAGTASFVGDLERIKNISFNNAKEISRSVQVIGTAAAAAFAAFAGAMLHVVEKTSEGAVHLKHLAESAGTTIEAMSGLAYAAKLVHMDVDQVALAMERFDKKLLAAQTGTKAAADIMQRVGIDPAKIRQSDEALKILAARFEKMPDGVEKTGEAMTLFGKAGAAMIPMLNLGAKGFQDALTEARAFGLVLSKDDVEAAERFQQNMTRLHGMMQGFETQVMKEVVPMLGTLTDLLVKDAASADDLKASIGAVVFLFQIFASSLVIILKLVGQMAISFEGMGALVRLDLEAIKLAAESAFAALSGNWAKSKDLWKQSKDAIEAAGAVEDETVRKQEANEKRLTERLAAIWGEREKNAKKTAAEIAAANAAAAAQIQAAIDQVTKRLEFEIATIGMTSAQIEIYKLQQLGAKDAVLGHVRALLDEKEALTKKHELFLKLTKLLATGAKLTDDMTEAIRRQNGEVAKQIALDQAAVLERLVDGIDQAQLASGEFAHSLEGVRSTLAKIGVVVRDVNLPKQFTDADQEIVQVVRRMEHFILSVRMTSKAMEELRLHNLGAAKEQIDAVTNLQEKFRELEFRVRVFATMRETATRAFSDLIFHGRKFRDVLHDILIQLGEMLLKVALFGKTGTGGLLGGVFQKITGVKPAAEAAEAAAIQVLTTAVTAAATATGLLTPAVTAATGATVALTPALGLAATAAGAAGTSCDFLSAQAIKAAIALQQVAASSSSSDGGGGLFGLLLGMQEGGPVTAGKPLLVGEKRPEIFIPSSSGVVLPEIPSGREGGASQSITVIYQVDARGADAGAERRLRAALKQSEERAVKRALVVQRELSLRTA